MRFLELGAPFEYHDRYTWFDRDVLCPCALQNEYHDRYTWVDRDVLCPCALQNRNSIRNLFSKWWG